jgi:hypothetical protein
MDEIRNILNPRKSIADYLKFNWIFERFYEKIILVLLSGLGVWKILNLVGWINF